MTRRLTFAALAILAVIAGGAISSPAQAEQPTATLTVAPVTTHGLVDTAYSATASASGGDGDYTFNVLGGSLPPGVSMSTAGVFSGTPTTAGSFAFTLNATDTSSPALHGSVSTSITIDPMSVATSTLPSTAVLDAYAAKLTALGGKAPLTWSITSGALPAGIKLAANGALSGTASCVPSAGACATGPSTFTVQAVDKGKPQNTATATLSISVTAERITTTSLPGVAVDVAYPATVLTKAGGGTAQKWSVSAGQLPPGLALTTTGHLTGRPTVAGTYPVHFHVGPTNPATTDPEATKLLTIVIAPMAIATSSLPNGAAKKAYTAKLVTVGGKTPLHWAVTGGALPAGLHLSAAGQLAGIPTTAGTDTITFTVTDSTAPTPYTAQVTLALTIAAAG